MKRNYFLLRPMPHDTNHMQDFLEKDIVAIGYPVGESLEGMNKDEIRNILKKNKYENGLGNVNLLVRSMKKDDIIVVPDDNEQDVYFAKITSDYIYDNNLDKKEGKDVYPHQRKVEWFFDKKPLQRSDFSEELRGSLRYPGTVANLTKHAEYISGILNLDFQKKSEITSLKSDAEQVLREFLESDSEEYRLRAAEIILKNK